MTFQTWSKTAATNATADATINWAEGQAPSSVNDSARAMMAAAAKYRDDTGGALTTAGGTTAYTLTTNQVLTALADGERLHVVMNATNTAASTLNVDGLGAKAIKKVTRAGEEDVQAGDLAISAHHFFQYDASANSAAGAWILVSVPSLGINGPRSITTLTVGAGTYTTPTWATSIMVFAQGAGGGGGSADAASGNVSCGTGGGGGGCGVKFIINPAATYAYVVGAGGAAETVGADTTFGVTVCTGSGGNPGATLGPGTIGASFANSSVTGSGDYYHPGHRGGDVLILSASVALAGGGGASHFGGGAAGQNSTGTGNAGQSYGGGGGGGFTTGSSRAGGAGAPGVIFVWEFG